MKEIALTHGKVALVDDEDFEYLNQWKWHVCNGYCVRFDCEKGWKNKVKIHMHRLILGLDDPKMLVDHIDSIKLNNQKHNLRKATTSQNNANRRAKKNGASKYLGVYQVISKKKGKEYLYWAAHIRSNKVGYYLGLFKSENDAAFAYNEKAKEIHGEFAKLNNVETQTDLHGRGNTANVR